MALLDRVEDDILGQAYFGSQALVFPILDLPDDVEGFGMVAVEAAAHGLPTVAFSAGGAVDAVSHGGSGYLIPPGNYPAFGAAVLRLLRGGDPSITRDTCAAFAAPFAWEHFGKRLRNICRNAISTEAPSFARS